MESRNLLTVMPSHLSMLASVAHSIRHPVGAMTGSSSSSAVETTPTAHERTRESFGARFQGPFTTGPGRFKEQALLVHMNAGGTANQFLHGNVLIQISSPKDPTQPLTGTAELFAKSVSTTGTVLVLDLSGPAPADPTKPPTRLTWTVNSSSGGLYTNATGQGTLTMTYSPGGKLPQRAFQSGTAGAIFQGQIQTTGVGNILQFSG